MPQSFRTQAEFRAWLARNHATESELIMRLFKVHARDRGIGYREALDEALCFGWIDGVRKALDEDSFTQRFTPRKKKSNWSSVNIKRVKELQREGSMSAAGLAAFEARDATAVAPYSFESAEMKLDPLFEKKLRANKKAWDFFQSQAPYYRRVTMFWVMSAKREETRARRFEDVLERCAKGKRIGLLEK
jgi:uncharacterized protein YdeI (YjbR/CyaY-like superfamily)